MLKELIACRHRSLIKNQTGLATAEQLFKSTGDRRFYDVYVRPTLVSYGASCKVLTAYHRDTEKKVRGSGGAWARSHAFGD